MSRSGAAASAHTSSLRDYLQVVRRRKWIIVQAVLLVPLAALVFSYRQEAQYQGSAEVLISRQNLAASLTGTQDPNLYNQADRIAQTQADLARVPEVAQRVIEKLGLSRTPFEFLAQSGVSAKQNADLLEFTVTDRDRALAARMATEYARAYTKYRLEVDTRSLEAARREVEARIADLEGHGDKSSSLHTSLVEKEQTLKTMEALQTSNASLVREAHQAQQVAPQPMRNAMLGLFLGLFLGVGLAFLREALDTRVRSSEEISDRLDLPLLARVPEPPRKLRRANMLAMQADPSGITGEAYRMLRTNVEFTSLGRDVRTIMVTSALQQEGKSTTIANLAVAMARAGQHVILVDLDLRRPFVDKFFDLGDTHGITQVALGHVSVDRALVNVPLTPAQALLARVTNGDGRTRRSGQPMGKLEVMTSGPIPPDPGEFVGTEALTRLLDELAVRADVVLIDAPPLFAVGDGLALSAKVDAVVVVTRMDIVRRPMLGELKRVLDTMPAPRLGFVVTGAESEDAYRGGYAGGGYYYRAYEQSREKTRK